MKMDQVLRYDVMAFLLLVASLILVADKDIIRVVVYGVFGLGILLNSLSADRGKEIIECIKLTLPVWIYFAYLMATTNWTISQNEASLSGDIERVFSTSVFIIAISLVFSRRMKDSKAIIQVMAILGAVGVAIALEQYFASPNLVRVSPTRVDDNPVVGADFYGILALLTAYMALYGKSRWLWPFYALFLLTILLSGSRGPSLAIIIASLILILGNQSPTMAFSLS